MGEFGPTLNIAFRSNSVDAQSVFAADLDGDGDIDVLSVFADNQGGNTGDIAWYENLTPPNAVLLWLG